jgi:sulfate adenylyltransferase
MHRSHEYLAKIAIDACDGLLIHSLIGKVKPGDIPADVRLRCIEALVDNYFVKDNLLLAGYPLDMRYAGPREALLHAVFRQNFGCSQMIIGRDHAGLGDFYTPFEAQEIFEHIPYAKGSEIDRSGRALLCEPMKIDWTFYCRKCDSMVSMKTCPHTKQDRVILSGTKLRKALSEGRPVPEHLGREEVLDILRDYYQGLEDRVEIKEQATLPWQGRSRDKSEPAVGPDRLEELEAIKARQEQELADLKSQVQGYQRLLEDKSGSRPTTTNRATSHQGANPGPSGKPDDHYDN